MEKTTKLKITMLIAMIAFILFYMVVFGKENVAIGVTILLAALMNLGNDLSFKPKRSFLKVFAMLLILGIAAYLNNPLTIFGCILTFIVVFGTTYGTYHLFGTNVYMPYLMTYFMMISSHVTLDHLPIRLLSLAFGAIFIVGLNIIINKKKDYKLSKATIDKLINELENGINSRLNGEEISYESFKSVNGFYLSIYNKLEYKYFPTKTHESVLNIVKSFQNIGYLISKIDFTDDELKYTKETLSKIRETDSEDIFEGIDIETREMSLILLNLEIIANEINNNLTEDTIIPDKKAVKKYIKPILKALISFKNPQFTFAFKMAFILFIWQLLTLMFNLPFTKWLYFVTIPVMLPYINDMKYVAKLRIKGTLVGVGLFAVIMILLPYIPIPSNILIFCIMLICIFIMIAKLKDKFILYTITSMISVSAALMYISPPEAIIYKILWVVIGVSVVSAFNFLFLPYSVEKETENNLKASYILNEQSIKLIKEKISGRESVNKTSLLIASNIVRENIEVTEDNEELFFLQLKITDICNFILRYLDIHTISEDLKSNIVGIIDSDNDVNDNMEYKDRVLAYCTSYVKGLYNEETVFFENEN